MGCELIAFFPPFQKLRGTNAVQLLEFAVEAADAAEACLVGDLGDAERHDAKDLRCMSA